MALRAQQNVLNGGVIVRKWIKELRKEKGMSQQNVADGIGVSQQYYNLIENGERKKELDISLVLKLASVFNVTVEFIIEQETVKGEV